MHPEYPSKELQPAGEKKENKGMRKGEEDRGSGIREKSGGGIGKGRAEM